MKKGPTVVFFDVAMLMVLGFLYVLVILLPHINPISVPVSHIERPPHLLIEIQWPPGSPDVDLWVQCPGDSAVGYSNRGGRLCDLLRDDLGVPDTTENWEIAISRGYPEGEYVFNAHLYRSDFGEPVTVKMAAWIKRQGEDYRQIATATKTLQRSGDEQTFIRFKLFPDGTIVPGSENDDFHPVREGWSRSLSPTAP